MINVECYMNDGANWQAQAVLAYIRDQQEVDSIVLDINGKTYSIRESIEGNLVITDIACNGSILVHPRTDNSIELR